MYFPHWSSHYFSGQRSFSNLARFTFLKERAVLLPAVALLWLPSSDSSPFSPTPGAGRVEGTGDSGHLSIQLLVLAMAFILEGSQQVLGRRVIWTWSLGLPTMCEGLIKMLLLGPQVLKFKRDPCFLFLHLLSP